MSTAERASPLEPRRIVFLALFLAVILHGGLLPFTLSQTYDAHIHMFFGDHYHRSWFDPWEPRWYTGFTVTAYPPGSHQLIGLLLYLVPHKVAFVLVQVLAVLILVLGVYRFSRLWVSDMAAALAALLCVGSTAIAETVHIFGQLPTTLSLGICLNATPYLYAWIREGRRADFLIALILTAGATAAHHVTPIFATLFFVAPLGLHAWSATLPSGASLLKPRTWPPRQAFSIAPLRGIIIGAALLSVIFLIVFPYWHWSITDPITQVSIPHGSRENFLEYPNFGLIFFIIPWGPFLALIPYITWCAFRTPLWPLAISVLICLLLGTGGTTPIPRLLLGPAFDILTFDRFTFWAVIMTLPFAGKAVISLLSGSAQRVMVAALGKTAAQTGLAGLAIGYAAAGVIVAGLPLVKPTQPAALDPYPIVQFMAKDDHNRWRYLTLGFGDQFAYHSALIDAYSVDGNYHSARRLPQLTSYSVERLENSKYLGLPGLRALRQIITNAEAYNLKYVFSNDAFYDPLLYFGGWTRLLRLSNGVVVWEKPGISPIDYPLPRQTFPAYKAIMWGTIPPAGLFLSLILLSALAIRRDQRPVNVTPDETIAHSPVSPRLITTVRCTGLAIALCGSLILLGTVLQLTARDNPETVLKAYYTKLDNRNFKAAYTKLDPAARPSYQVYLKILRGRGGMVWSYAKLIDVEMVAKHQSGKDMQVEITRTYLTALGPYQMTSMDSLVKTSKGWRVRDPVTPKTLTNALMVRDAEPVLQDLSATRIAARGTSTLSFTDPVITASEPVLINSGQSIRIIGAVTNQSSYAACLDVIATGQFGDRQLVTQRMGPLGSHRLAPGETRHYSIEFEGRLNRSDTAPAPAAQTEHYRLPSFLNNPDPVRVQVSTFSCQSHAVSGIVLNDIQRTEDNTLNVTLTNHGTKVAGIVKLSLIYFDQDGRAILVEPHYLETNLIPGELKTETIALHANPTLQVIKVLDQPKINGELKQHGPDMMMLQIPLAENALIGSVAIEVDAMPFAPTL